MHILYLPSRGPSGHLCLVWRDAANPGVLEHTRGTSFSQGSPKGISYSSTLFNRVSKYLKHTLKREAGYACAELKRPGQLCRVQTKERRPNLNCLSRRACVPSSTIKHRGHGKGMHGRVLASSHTFIYVHYQTLTAAAYLAGRWAPPIPTPAAHRGPRPAWSGSSSWPRWPGA